MEKLVMRLEHAKLGVPTSFPAFLVGKPRVFSPNPVRNSHYNY